jgi:hypothetical protein
MIGIVTEGFYCPPVRVTAINTGGAEGGVPMTMTNVLKSEVSAQTLRPTIQGRGVPPPKPSGEPLKPITTAKTLKPDTEADGPEDC